METQKATLRQNNPTKLEATRRWISEQITELWSPEHHGTGMAMDA